MCDICMYDNFVKKFAKQGNFEKSIWSLKFQQQN